MSLAIYHHNNNYEDYVSTFLAGISQTFIVANPNCNSYPGIFYVASLMFAGDTNGRVGSLNKKITPTVEH